MGWSWRSPCSPYTSSIWVRIPLKYLFFFCTLMLREKSKNNAKTYPTLVGFYVVNKKDIFSALKSLWVVMKFKMKIEFILLKVKWPAANIINTLCSRSHIINSFLFSMTVPRVSLYNRKDVYKIGHRNFSTEHACML